MWLWRTQFLCVFHLWLNGTRLENEHHQLLISTNQLLLYANGFSFFSCSSEADFSKNMQSRAYKQSGEVRISSPRSRSCSPAPFPRSRLNELGVIYKIHSAESYSGLSVILCVQVTIRSVMGLKFGWHSQPVCIWHCFFPHTVIWRSKAIKKKNLNFTAPQNI